MKYFVLDQKDNNGKTHTQASLSFSDAQRGIPSWLAAPGPMGSLEYISPDANVVAGFVVKNPHRWLTIFSACWKRYRPTCARYLDNQQAERGLNIRNDMRAPLGGEFAFAIDGPILPTPSWKLVFEVNDPAHLQQTLERVVGEVNKEAAKFGKRVWPGIRRDLGGRTYYTLKSADFGLLEVNYTYVNGYMIVGPSRALVEKSLRSQASGCRCCVRRSSRRACRLTVTQTSRPSSITTSARLVQPFAKHAASNLPSGPQQAGDQAMAPICQPTLAYAYAQGDSITFAANTEGGPFGLSPATLLGMPNSLEMQSIIHRMGMKK